jgi:hypothetical protein
MIHSWKAKTILILILSAVVSGCATCSKDPNYGVDRGKADPLTAADRCAQQYLW